MSIASTTVTEQLIGGIDYLTSLEYKGLRVLDVMHAVLIAYAYRSALGSSHREIGWAQGFLATIIMCAGGGSTVCILRGEPLGILKSNMFWGLYGAAYWAVFSNGYVYPVLDYLLSLPLVEVTFTLADAILRNWAIIHIGVLGVDSTLGADKLVAKLVCGTLAGSGGGFWIDAFNLTHHHWSFSTPRWLHATPSDVKACFATSLFYIVATSPAMMALAGVQPLGAAEAEAWSAVVLAVGLLHGCISARWQRAAKTEQEKKKTQ